MEILGMKLSLIAIGAVVGVPVAWFLGGWAAIIFVLLIGAGIEIWRKLHPTSTVTDRDFIAVAGGGLLATIAVLAFR